MKVQPFHLAIPVYDLKSCRKFYGETLGCGEGRSSDHWVDFNFFGHQLVIHYKPKEENIVPRISWKKLNAKGDDDKDKDNNKSDRSNNTNQEATETNVTTNIIDMSISPCPVCGCDHRAPSVPTAPGPTHS